MYYKQNSNSFQHMKENKLEKSFYNDEIYNISKLIFKIA
jgi:hypothetical protein